MNLIDLTTSKTTNLADLTATYLNQLGVKYVFGVPGGAISPWYDALARSERQGGLRAIVARHESGAAFMADGYARESGQLGVCCATTGPGTTNLITGVASAYANNIPLLVLTAQTRLSSFGKGAFQESSPDAIDTHGMFDKCTRYNSLVTHPAQFEEKLVTAILAALRQPQGPAHLSVPMDIFRESTSGQTQFTNLEQLLTEPALVDTVALDRLYQAIVDVLNQGQQIVVLIGGECGNAIEHIVKFAELIHAPMVTTPEGKSWPDPYHPLHYGVFGFAGHRSARQVLAGDSVGLILAIGTSLGEWSTDGWDEVLMNNRLVHIHYSRDYFARSRMARLQVCGNLTTLFETLCQRLEAVKQTGTLRVVKSDEAISSQPLSERRMLGQQCAPRHLEIDDPKKYRQNFNDSSSGIKPQRLMCELTLRLPPETRFLADAGGSFTWATHYLFHKHAGAYQVAMGLGSMGWAIGASIGTALAAPGKPVVCITGDGSYLMNGQEITVAVAEQLPVIFVILNDQALGMVKSGQHLTGAEPIGYHLPLVNFAMMAKAVGAESYLICTVEDFKQVDYAMICTRQGPTLLDVRIDSGEMPPMGLRAQTLSK